MHLLIPFAGAAGEPASQALAGLELPHLQRWLARSQPAGHDDGDEYSLTPPHERVLGRHLGWQAADGCWPWAAWRARQDGALPEAPPAQPSAEPPALGLVTPCHWAVGTDQVTLLDPDQLDLQEAESRELLATVQPLFDSEGWQLRWGAATRWYAIHPSLAGLRTASLDRVIGRNVDRWMPDDPQARRIRRLQSEVQMVLHQHPVNEAREARGLPAVNSFWLSGCGVLPPGTPAGTGSLSVAATLRLPALADDWPAWRSAWQALDAGAVQALLREADRDAAATLTLCGERHARSWRAAPMPPWWRRLAARRRTPAPQAVLEAL
jgi:hypothetical protein